MDGGPAGGDAGERPGDVCSGAVVFVLFVVILPAVVFLPSALIDVVRLRNIPSLVSYAAQVTLVARWQGASIRRWAFQ